MFMETSQQESTYLAFTKEAAEFKMAEFEAASPYDFKNKADAQKEVSGIELCGVVEGGQGG